MTGQRSVGIPEENRTTFKPSQPIRMALTNSLIRAKNRFVKFKSTKANFGRNILIEISGRPPWVISNIPT